MKRTHHNDLIQPTLVQPGRLQEAFRGGLTKREFFAVAAMQGLVAGDSILINRDLVNQAVTLADMLIEELNQRPVK